MLKPTDSLTYSTNSSSTGGNMNNTNEHERNTLSREQEGGDTVMPDKNFEEHTEAEDVYISKSNDLYCLQEKLQVITSTFEAAIKGKRREYKFLRSNLNRLQRALGRKFRSYSPELFTAWITTDSRIKREAKILKELQKELQEKTSSEIKTIEEYLQKMQQLNE